MTLTTPQQDIDRIVHGNHHDPFAILGMHTVLIPNGQSIVIRAYRPGAEKVTAKSDRAPVELIQHQDTGFFEAIVPNEQTHFLYELDISYPHNNQVITPDPYTFPPILSDYDLHLFSESNHHHIFEKLGAHPITFHGIQGVSFAVWAPNAKRISVMGDFNQWNGSQYGMRNRGTTGVWEIFIPHLEPNTTYKYEIITQSDDVIAKSDPYAFYAEHRPKTASIVYDLTDEGWTDNAWIEQRSNTSAHNQPMAIYEVHLGSWRRNPDENNRSLTYRELAHELVDYVLEMGYTHLELMPVMEHPLDKSWGYQVTGYYAPTSRFGTPDDFKYFVNHCHNNGIGVILDWVPAHYPKDAHGLAFFDGSALYEHADPRQGAHPDWGTLIFNYGRNEVRNFLTANAIFWAEKYHIDGLRVDAVASMLYLDYSREGDEWVPNKYGGRENLEAIDFMKQVNEVIHSRFPGILMIAEESTAWPGVSRPIYLGGLGYGFKWNMGWMNDMLSYIEREPIHRRHHHDSLTFGLVYAFHENFILVLSHDEVVHGKRSLLDKMPGDRWQKFANLRLFYTYMYGHPGKKLLFMGSDLGQWTEWNEDDSLPWHLLEEPDHAGLQRFVKDLNPLYRNEPALSECDFDPKGFDWLDFNDAENSVISFQRRAENGTTLLFICNFTPVPRENYRIGVPLAGHYNEILNSDAEIYGGSNKGNLGGVSADNIASHGHKHSIEVTIPPLASVVFKRT
ncbi:MAG: 1,4-alpha-glucan branching protein GlgB [Candidatus Latescibacteria bacterium]|nr:1,4-alpha-glucan branching protein GlgB [Candidatus Latescibacterota bacterium]